MKIDGHDFPDKGIVDSDNICRFSAQDFIAQIGVGWLCLVRSGQLVLEKPVGIDASILVYTSVMRGKLAGAQGMDSIRIVLKTTGAYQKKGHWTTRTFPGSITDYDEALRYIVMKIGLKVEQLMKATRPCPDCNGVQVKLASHTEANPDREFWKCGGSCGSTWKGWVDGIKNGNKTRPCPDCGHEQTMHISRSAKNPGREYWKCDFCPDGKRWKEWDGPRRKTRLTVEPATITIKLEAEELEKTLRALKSIKTEGIVDTSVWIEKWDFESSSSGKTYTISQHEDGYFGCSCPAWIYQTDLPRKPCKHITEFLLNRPFSPDTAADTLADEEEQDWGWF